MPGDVVQVGSFGDVLPDEAVGVLVGAALPGRVGASEVALRIEGGFDFLEVSEFFAVVEGDGLDELPCNLLEGVHDGAGNGMGSAVLYFAGERESAFAIDEGDDSGTALFAVDEVNFPITRTLAPIDDFGSLLDEGRSEAYASIDEIQKETPRY